MQKRQTHLFLAVQKNNFFYLVGGYDIIFVGCSKVGDQCGLRLSISDFLPACQAAAGQGKRKI
jgi:hypothetical protein